MSAQTETLIDGKYTIIAKLREGGMGTIYKVHHNLLDETRVIKVMRSNVMSDPDMQRRFVQEAKLVTKLKHPNIAAVYDFALDGDDTAYIVMEYVDGINLAEIVKAVGAVDVPLVLELAAQSLQALSFLHKKNVVHRDISPDNLMLTLEERRPVVKLIDLGIAKTLDSSDSMTRTGMFVGKLKYASPEQLGQMKPGEQIDSRSDIYSMGVVLYEMLTGVAPIQGDNGQSLIAGHLFRPPIAFEESDSVGRIPSDVRGMVLKTLAKDREDRYLTTDDMLLAVRELQTQYPPNGLGDDAASIIADIRGLHPELEMTPTPSVQNRLDRNFGIGTTPPPMTSTTRARATAPTRVSGPKELLASQSEETIVEGPARPVAASTPPPATSSSSSGLKYGGIAVALLIVGGIAYFAGHNRTGNDTPPPVVTASQPAPAATTPASTSAPIATAATTSATVAAPVAPPVVAPPPGADRSAFRNAANNARSAAESARNRAQAAQAPSHAAAQFNRAASEQGAANRLFERGEYSSALDRYSSATNLFLNAEGSARDAMSRQAAVSAPAATPTPAPPPVVVAETHKTPVVVDTPAPKPVQASPSAPSAEAQVRDTIARYVSAQESLDASAYARIYPAAQVARISSAFASLRSQKLDVTIHSVDVSGSKATVRASESRTAVPKAGAEQHINGERTYTLAKRGDDWVITAIQ